MHYTPQAPGSAVSNIRNRNIENKDWNESRNKYFCVSARERAIPSTDRASYLPVPSVHIETTEQTSKPCDMRFIYSSTKTHKISLEGRNTEQNGAIVLSNYTTQNKHIRSHYLSLWPWNNFRACLVWGRFLYELKLAVEVLGFESDWKWTMNRLEKYKWAAGFSETLVSTKLQDTNLRINV
jgi:hypothetical protein